MSPELTNFLFEALNFGVLAALLAWLVFKPIRKALDAERAAREKAESDLKQRQAEVAEKQQNVDEAHKQLQQELDKRRNELLAEANKDAEAIRAEARDRSAEEHSRARSELEQLHAAEVEAAAGTLGKVAGESVRRLLSTIEGPELDDALVRAACSQLATLNGAELGDVTVESARKLTPASSAAIADALKQKFDARLVPELGAGVRITTAAGQVDASALAFSRTAQVQVADALKERNSAGA